MNEPIIISSWSGHGTPGQLISREIKNAVARWETAKHPAETWTLCAWDGCFRKPSDIKALVLVP